MIVVTGATGNVGRELVRALTSAGEQVTAVSRHPAASSRQDARPGGPAPDSLAPGGLAPDSPA
uniref:NAD-dependent epimerase/dehydratase family protein n=1 Tax=Nonomuraea lactucae TaxID=2249762 RepID=UPI000DE2D8F6